LVGCRSAQQEGRILPYFEAHPQQQSPETGTFGLIAKPRFRLLAKRTANGICTLRIQTSDPARTDGMS